MHKCPYVVLECLISSYESNLYVRKADVNVCRLPVEQVQQHINCRGLPTRVLPCRGVSEANHFLARLTLPQVIELQTELQNDPNCRLSRSFSGSLFRK